MAAGGYNDDDDDDEFYVVRLCFCSGSGETMEARRIKKQFYEEFLCVCCVCDVRTCKLYGRGGTASARCDSVDIYIYIFCMCGVTDALPIDNYSAARCDDISHYRFERTLGKLPI